ncbi:MAG: outer membrane protein assembly factor BamD [Alphaproteobacteria bacterium]|nr:outer membrane protein assembly factor BamD [Alphaproteobacteria bacterium]
MSCSPASGGGAKGSAGSSRRAFRWLAVVALLMMAACASSPPAISDKEEPPETLYNRGMDQLTRGDGNDAIRSFNEVERQHPYSIWATKAILMAAYTNYAMNRYTEAIVGLERYIRLHPGSRDYAYAFYLKALCYYEQIADVERDQGITRQAMTALQDVIKRFPKSKYARDAQLKYALTEDQLAGQEMAIGRWYQDSGQLIAAINRFKTVVNDYQTTSHVPEALHRLTESYLALGIKEEAQKTAAVLGHNFPGSEWYLDSYVLMTGIKPQEDAPVASVPRRSWWGRTWNSIF